MASRETENNAYAKFWGDKQRTLWYVMVFLEWSIVVVVVVTVVVVVVVVVVKVVVEIHVCLICMTVIFYSIAKASSS